MIADFRYAWRALRHHRFALVAGLSIALGIGANAVMFSRRKPKCRCWFARPGRLLQ